jgi:microcystin-dependent protein
MEPFPGEIRMFASNFAPVGWALCEGQLLSVDQFSLPFELLYACNARCWAASA